MSNDRDMIVFPELDTYENPDTGVMMTDERMVTDEIEDVYEASGGLGSPLGAEEGERVFELKQRGTVPASELGGKVGESNEVTPEDVFVGPSQKSTSNNKDTPDPRRVHESRSEYAQKQDLARDARITTDPDQYASRSNSYDFPGIDTGPTFRDVQDDFDEESFLDTIL
jgi:hypothetical protein